jgi:Tol biopolymer transport system component
MGACRLSGSELAACWRATLRLALRIAADRVLLARLGPTEAPVFIANADGSGGRALTEKGSLNYNPSWSAKGDWIVFTSEREGSADLYRVHPDGSGLERLTDDPAYDDQVQLTDDQWEEGAPAWQPRGRGRDESAHVAP